MPTTRRRTTAKPPDTFERVTIFLERFGLPTVLLLGLGYFGFQVVVKPITESYMKAIADVAVTTQELEQAIEADNQKDGDRVREITEALKSLENKIDLVISKLSQ